MSLIKRPAWRARTMVLLALAVSTTTSSCVSSRSRAAESSSASLQFTNESLEPVEVYVGVAAISTVSLGTVMQGERRTFVIPGNVIRQGSNINFSARILSSGRTVRSGPISTRDGALVRVILPNGADQLIVEANGK